MRFWRTTRTTSDRAVTANGQANRSRSNPRIARAVIGMATLSLLGSVFSPVASATAASATTTAGTAACTSPTFSLYPGSGISNVRYGQVDFHFYACSDQSPSSWSASITKATVNSTGKNLGFFIDGTGISTDSTGSNYRYYTGRIYASTCTPRVGWPCSRSYSFSVKFNITTDRYGNRQVYMGARSAPTGMALFTTP